MVRIPSVPGGMPTGALGLSLLIALLVFSVNAEDDPSIKPKGDPPSKSTTPDVAELLKRLGDDEYQVREEAQAALLKLPGTVIPVLKKAEKTTTDPEVRARLKKIVRQIAQRDVWASLTDEERAITAATFQTQIRGNSVLKSATGKVYASGGFAICDIGNIRLAVKGLKVSRDQSMYNLYTNPPPSLISRSRSRVKMPFESEVKNRATYCRLEGIRFELSDGKLILDGQKIPFGEKHKVIFVSKEGKLLKSVELDKPKVQGPVRKKL